MLRIVAMLMIVVLHILGLRGKVLSASAQANLINYETAMLMETAAYCAVNVYAIISGYVGVNSKYKPYKLISIWLMVFLYQVLFAAIEIIITHQIPPLRNIAEIIMPGTFGAYWYFTAYIVLFIFIPLLNRIIHNAEKRELEWAFALMTVFFCVFSVINKNNSFMLNNGSSAIWLMIMYLVGGYLKKYSVADKFTKTQLLLTYAICSIATWLFMLAVRLVTEKVFGEAKFELTILKYTFITIVICAVSLVMLFSKLDIKASALKKFISVMAPATFGVYIIHLNGSIARTFENYFEKCTVFAQYNPIVMVIAVLLTAVGIYLVCSFIDLIRIKLFKLLKVDVISEKIVSIFSEIPKRGYDILIKGSKLK